MKNLYTEKLASSGLSEADGRKLGFEFLAPAQTQRLHHSFKPLPAIKIPYWDPRAPSKPLAAHPKWPGFYRLRYLKEAGDFAQQAKAKPIRYTQEPGSGVCAYFPRLVDWPAVMADVTKPIIITEGELKAAKASKEGYPTIGLGGVYNFRSARAGVPFLPELEAVTWPKRLVYLAFDSDLRSNPNVLAALNLIAEELYQRGALPHVLMLPELQKDQKTGLDDFLVAEPAEKFDLLIEEAEPLTLSRPLWELNQQVTYVFQPPVVVVDETMSRMTVSSFRDGFGNRQAHRLALDDKGSVSLKAVPVADAWLKWPLRDSAGRLTYAPGHDRRLPGPTLLSSAYNLWPGWGCEPKKGDVRPFVTLLKHLFKGSPHEDLEWFLRWLAFPIQHPGAKMTSSAMLYGIKHGTGKSLIGYTLKPIYGQNFTSIKQVDLVSTFNEWANGRQFVLVDDITGTANREQADVLKKLITQQELWINQKNIQQYTIPDCINYLFTSNQPDALFLEDDDRRFFVHEVRSDPLPEDFYVSYDLWLSSDRAGPAVFQYLLDVDLGDFQPHAHARRTTAKDRMISDARSDLGSWVRQLRDSPDAVLKVGQQTIEGELFTNSHLLELYDPSGAKRVTANGLGRELKRAGFFQIADGAIIKGPDGKPDRWYAIRNRDRWLTADRTVAERYLQPADPKRRKY